jgi:hypothetical protein
MWANKVLKNSPALYVLIRVKNSYIALLREIETINLKEIIVGYLKEYFSFHSIISHLVKEHFVVQQDKAIIL